MNFRLEGKETRELDVARYHNTTIDLRTYPREHFQILYEASLQCEVTCTSCHEPVKLYLGISQSPHFYHISSAHTCNEEEMKANKEEPVLAHASVERDGFRFPISRAIHDEHVTSSWKNVQPYTATEQFTGSSQQPSYHILNEEQIPLDSAQYEAVQCTEGPLLILAGAGSGKTRVLTARTAYMIQAKGIDPKSIMLVTFTSKAAKEMKDRLHRFSSLSPLALHSVTVGTFHSICFKMLLHFDPQRYSPNALIKYEWQIERILKDAGAEIGLDEKEFPYDQSMAQISYWKNTLTSSTITPKDKWEEQVLYLYKRYEEQKAKQGQFDFDDMLLGCYHMLLENKELLERYQRRFQYFLIDEFQDINKVQYEIIKLLSSTAHNICAVGDDDQSIYAFRGSDPSFILHFDEEFPNATVITLHENYRSSHSIVTAANKVITRNKKRRSKKMKAQFQLSSPPTFFFPYDEEEEATIVVTDIKERIEQGARPSDFAILYRTNTASRAIFERLCQSTIPFTTEQGADSFYKRKIVRYLLSFMRLSVNEEDTSALADLLSALFLKQSVMQDLKRISILEDCTLVSALAKLPSIMPFQQKKLQRIVPIFRKLRNLTPVTAIEIIEKDMGFSEFIKKRGGEGNQMEKGSDDIRDVKVVARKFKTLPELLEHADHMTAMTAEIKKRSASYKDAVQMLTIHKAKGLEYKHVYVLGGVDGSLPHDYSLESFREGDEMPLEEERRLAYVAMTRAKESLLVSVPMMRRGKTAHPSRLLSPLLK